MSRDFITPTSDGTLLNLRVSPGARRTSIVGPYGESALKLKVAAPPRGGRANAEAERFLAELLGIPRPDVTVVRGSSSRDKIFLVRGLEVDEVEEFLLAHLR